MKKILYFESIGGASGDMMLGALLHLGVQREYLQQEIDSLLGPGQAILHLSHREVHGIRAARVRVETAVEVNHHRHLSQILHIIGEANFHPEVKKKASAVFQRLAEAEGRVHGTTPEQVHFHEVGALDAIVDIVGTCLGIHHLGVDTVYSGALKTGRGTVRAAHGILPLPAPAMLELASGRTLEYLDMEGELTTPTGAALLTTLADERMGFSLHPEQVGYGCGERDFPNLPNLLRATLGTLA